jgi:uncharacterized membrane protein required for colicin V production
MALSGTEIPGSGESGNEALSTIAKLNRGIYTLIFYMLGVALILLILGRITLAAIGKAVPESRLVIIATIIGWLVGAVSTKQSLLDNSA